MKLNLGCGRNPLDGYINVDRAGLPGVDVVHDLETFPFPFDDATVSDIVGVDFIEHVRDPLAVMDELYRIAQPGATCTFALPYGSHDAAWEDPTHTRPYFVGSWSYFSQPNYFRADYGYEGDWDVQRIELELVPGLDGATDDEKMSAVQTMRNVVVRQTATLVAVKPLRPADAALRTAPPVAFT